jgi:hypothetical protein
MALFSRILLSQPGDTLLFIGTTVTAGEKRIRTMDVVRGLGAKKTLECVAFRGKKCAFRREHPFVPSSTRYSRLLAHSEPCKEVSFIFPFLLFLIYLFIICILFLLERHDQAFSCLFFLLLLFI